MFWVIFLGGLPCTIYLGGMFWVIFWGGLPCTIYLGGCGSFNPGSCTPLMAEQLWSGPVNSADRYDARWITNNCNHTGANFSNKLSLQTARPCRYIRGKPCMRKIYQRLYYSWAKGFVDGLSLLSPPSAITGAEHEPLFTDNDPTCSWMIFLQNLTKISIQTPTEVHAEFRSPSI